MKIHHYFLLAKTNLLRRKKALTYNIILVVLALSIIGLTNIMTVSLDGFINKYLYNSVEFRTLIFGRHKIETDFLSKVQNIVKGDSRILELYHEIFGVAAKIDDIGSLVGNAAGEGNKRFGEISLHAAKQQDKNFLINGRNIQAGERNVGIIPKHFYPAVHFQIEYFKDDTVFLDGDSLIGKTINIIYQPFKLEDGNIERYGSYNYSFEVIGTYDILPNSYYPYDLLIPYEDLKEIVETIDQNSVGLAEKFSITYGIIVDDQKNVEDVINKLNSEGILAKRKSELGYIGVISKFIVRTGYILGYMILLLSMINIYLSMSADIRGRKGEIGLMKAMGYYDSCVSKIMVMEAAIIGIVSMFITIGIEVSSVFLLKHIIYNYMSLYMQGLEVNLGAVTLLQTTLLALIIPILSTYLNTRNIEKITPKAALNEGAH